MWKPCRWRPTSTWRRSPTPRAGISREGTSTSSRALLSSAKAGAARGLETLYTAGFRGLGGLRRRRARLLVTPGSQSVLAIAPHPDDETIACGGTLALHARAGDRVRVLFVTDGRLSRAFGLGPAEMASRRRAEAEAAASALGVEALWLGLPEGSWSEGELLAAAAPLVARLAPDVVYAPSRVDFHPEHVRVACALAPLLTGSVRVYGVQVPLTSVLVNLVAPVATALPALRVALSAYVTQSGNAGRALRQRRYAAAFHGVPGSAEELWELPAPLYAELHRRTPGETPFRGLRSFPLSDPLAYAAGRAARRALAARG